ncbi:MAG: dephospho-CoA kinase [Lachnospiraceae bacterium]|nr:dephospho-CoA kinase [Lachnospiraceae bacterium]
MKIIGITGGVGAGKTEVIRLIEKMCCCTIVVADDLARSLEKRGEVCYEPLVGLLGKDVLGPDGEIDSRKMAQAIFADGGKLLPAVNAIVHPAVKQRIREMIADSAADGVEWFFIEAALLIEDGYDKIADELWYVYADEKVRRQRLKDSRGYSDEKISSIMASQSSDSVFRKHCSVVIDNSFDRKHTEAQLAGIFNSDDGVRCDRD